MAGVRGVKVKKRYWAYAHDADGNLIIDFGDFDELTDAISAVIDNGLDEDIMGRAVRVIDNEVGGGGYGSQTVWLAGPASMILVPQPLPSSGAWSEGELREAYGK